MKIYLQKQLGNFFINELLSTEIGKNVVKEIGIIINENSLKFVLNAPPEHHDDILKIAKQTFNVKYFDRYLVLKIKYRVVWDVQFVGENFTLNDIKDFTYYYFIPEVTSNRYIFKYHSVNEYLEKLLINNTLWFNSPESFKDITDCKFEIDTEVSQKNIIYFYYNKYIQDSPKEDMIISIPVFEKSFQLPSVNQFRMDLLNHHFNGVITKLGITCFSEKYDHKLMWDQYASGYAGVCLIFDTEISESDYYKFKGKKVRYFESPQKYFFDGTGHLEIGHVVYTKTREYEFENEVREIINFQFEEAIDRNIKFNPLALKGIIFGPSCTESTKDKVKQLVSDAKYNHVELINSSIDIRLKFQIESSNLDLKVKKATSNN